MPDTRNHRGPHPADERLFSREALPDLQRAVADLSWLLTRGYPETSSLKLVGDRQSLTARQRAAVARCACSDSHCLDRAERRIKTKGLKSKTILIDGFNLITTVEAALAGGVILEARDRCYRDMASMHGSYRVVEETEPALGLICESLTNLGVHKAICYLDQPVSNSGKLKSLMIDRCRHASFRAGIQLVSDPDRILAEAEDIVVTADRAVIDQCGSWTNLARHIVRTRIPGARVLPLAAATPPPNRNG